MQERPSTFHQPDETNRPRGSRMPQGWRRALWPVLLAAAGFVFSLGFACVTPFVAVVAVAALTLNRQDALLLAAAVWLANQLVGFTLLGYPWTANAVEWGIALGAASVLAVVVAQATARFCAGRGTIVASLAAFAAAFILYEGGLAVIAAGLLGGTDGFTLPIVVRVLEINAAAFALFLVLGRLAMAGGLAARPILRPAAIERHA